MTCPKCGAEPKESWYDGSCIEHGRPKPVEGRWYWVRYNEHAPQWLAIPLEYWRGLWWEKAALRRAFLDDGDQFVDAWLPIPTVEELLLTTKGKV